MIVTGMAVADEKSTGDKVGEVLDKIQKLENDKSVYFYFTNKILKFFR